MELSKIIKNKKIIVLVLIVLVIAIILLLSPSRKLVGDWTGQDGTSLKLLRNGTCILDYEYTRGLSPVFSDTIKGTWYIKGDVLYLSFDGNGNGRIGATASLDELNDGVLYFDDTSREPFYDEYFFKAD